jgi:hypothetical protein
MRYDDAVERATAAACAVLCRGFDDAEAAWAATTLHDNILPRLVPDLDDVSPVDVDEAVADALGDLDADDPATRYANLVDAHFESLLAPTAAEAYHLAGRALEGETSPEVAAVLEDEILRLVQAVEADVPEVGDTLADLVEQALLDCAFAGGDVEATSRRIEIDQQQRAIRAAEDVRTGSPDPRIDAMASEARASLAVSFEAARIAADAGTSDRDQLLPIRTVYDHGLDVLDAMNRTFGDDAVRRVVDDRVRADLLYTLRVPITPGEWDQDSTPFGILSTRLSRRV